MNTSTELVPLPEDQAREAINRWSLGFFRVRYLGDKIFLDKIVPCFSYNVRLQTQYEERSVAPVSVPYHGQPLDNNGTSPEPWDITVRRPDDFEERTETLPVSHTDRVSMCSQCASIGSIDCGHCHGAGKVTCPSCGGRGYIDRQETRHEHDAAGKLIVRTVDVRDNCTRCFNGRVSCSACAGNGRTTCPSCEGAGSVRTFDQLTVHFRDAVRKAVLDTTDLPDELLGRLTGKTIFAQRDSRIDGCPGMPRVVEECARKMLQESQTLDERQQRVLFQHLAVKRVPVHEVHYTYAGVPRRLWIYGDGLVHAPGAPWRRDRLFKIVASIAGAIVVVALLIILWSR